MEMEHERDPDRFRMPLWSALLAGAVGSVTCTLWVGQHNHSRLLAVLFTAWVVSPFVALYGARQLAQSWRKPSRSALVVAILVVALLSPAIYGWVALGTPITRPAFPFLMVPLVSWLAIAGITLKAELGKRRAKRDPLPPTPPSGG